MDHGCNRRGQCICAFGWFGLKLVFAYGLDCIFLVPIRANLIQSEFLWCCVDDSVDSYFLCINYYRGHVNFQSLVRSCNRLKWWILHITFFRTTVTSILKFNKSCKFYENSSLNHFLFIVPKDINGIIQLERNIIIPSLNIRAESVIKNS